ncbi:Fur family transcriptional regulator [Desulfovibrio psychrotolerans]|uniref:Transcriptional repressor n=1 Tax=Desulfovibrio psychrotolerans TaxID=415242 RepID=A0A7J0BRE4_9BACT|nr:Fur family transcriptional regulator [Desulfovibrio psychrotolerans]GFM36259.1 transcriptional repressor [Desulfovibrio psychrotolerans]
MTQKTDTQNRLKQVLAHLKSLGKRLTPQRIAIIKAIIDHPGHPTAEQIHQAILPHYPTVSLATVYKTINLLKAADEILDLEFHDYGSRYDARRPHPHPHLICTRCGVIMDTELADIETLTDGLARKAGFSASSFRLDIFGLCPKCTQK